MSWGARHYFNHRNLLINIFLLIFAFSFFYFSYIIFFPSIEQQKKRTSTPNKGFFLTVEPNLIDLGFVEQLPKIPFNFQIKNDTKFQGKVIDVMLPCSCTNLDLPTPVIVPANGAIDVKGYINTQSRRGFYNPTIGISYRRGDQEDSETADTILVSMHLDINPSLLYRPLDPTIHDLGPVTINLSRNGNFPFQIHNIIPSDSNIVCDLKPGLNTYSKSFELIVKIKPTAPQSPASQRLFDPNQQKRIELRTSIESEQIMSIPINIETK